MYGDCSTVERAVGFVFTADIPTERFECETAAHEAGLTEIRLIHGRGKGIQRGIVQSALEQNPLVESFYDAPESHLGATVVVLKR